MPGRWRKPVLLGLVAAVLLVVIVVARRVMTPFVLALVLAYVLTPAVSLAEARLRLPRALAIIVVYVVVLGSLYGFVRLTAPRVGQELGNLARELRHDAQVAKDSWIPAIEDRLNSWGLSTSSDPAPPEKAEPIVITPRPDGSYAVDLGDGIAVRPKGDAGWVIVPHEPPDQRIDLNRMADQAIGRTAAYVRSNAVDLLKYGGNLVAAAARTVFVFGITLMLAAYLILTREKILAFFGSLVRPSSRASFDALVARIDEGLSGVVRGQLIICLINGGLSAVGFALLGLKYWPVLALIATVLSLIPIFGVIVSSVPAVAIGLTQSIGTGFLVLAWIVVVHQIEANLLNPKIMGDAAKLHPVLVIFSLIVGEHLFGALGALLAVPAMSVAQSFFLHLIEIVRREEHREDATDSKDEPDAKDEEKGEAPA